MQFDALKMVVHMRLYRTSFVNYVISLIFLYDSEVINSHRMFSSLVPHVFPLPSFNFTYTSL